MSTASHSSCGSASTRARFWSAIQGAGEAFATGKAVNLAMRLEQAAPPGEILLGDSTYTVVGHAVEAEPAEPVELGALGRMPAYRLVALGDAVRPLGSASLVGRSDELAWLRAAFAGVCAERRSRVVAVVGEAGVGKSRLASELISGLGGEAVALNGRCVSYGEARPSCPWPTSSVSRPRPIRGVRSPPSWPVTRTRA